MLELGLSKAHRWQVWIPLRERLKPADEKQGRRVRSGRPTGEESSIRTDKPDVTATAPGRDQSREGTAPHHPSPQKILLILLILSKNSPSPLPVYPPKAVYLRMPRAQVQRATR